jgi:sugar lactone lactonase YvrE
MTRESISAVFFALAALTAFSACQTREERQKAQAIEQETTPPDSTGLQLERVATSPFQWTGITISKGGRIYVNFPRWSDTLPVSVAEVFDGQIRPFPDGRWQMPAETDSNFICVQSVFVDDRNRLWVVDPANPKFQGVVKRGPRLFQFDLATNRLVRAYKFPPGLIDKNSYLNDVRIDSEREVAYLTDSGTGGILTVDLKTGRVQRRLAGHPSVLAEVDSLMFQDGSVFKNKVHSDGLELSPDRRFLYYMALSGHSMYRVPTAALLDPRKDPAPLVEKVADIKAADGLLFGADGLLYLAGLEDFSVYTLDTAHRYQSLISEKEIQWADSFAQDTAGVIYFTTSQLHLPREKRGAYNIFKIKR